MLVEKAKDYYLNHELNCAESVLNAANDIFDLDIKKNGLRIMAAFGGGMGIESVCGAITGALAALSVMFCENKAHESPELKELCRGYFAEFEEKYHSNICSELKEKYRTEDEKCLKVIEMAAELLEKVIKEEKIRLKNKQVKEI